VGDARDRAPLFRPKNDVGAAWALTGIRVGMCCGAVLPDRRLSLGNRANLGLATADPTDRNYGNCDSSKREQYKVARDPRPAFFQMPALPLLSLKQCCCESAPKTVI
jgi:hypothetical protein